MGKSDKKVKSDRINSLRKQYDAFLEEDKKRKERNDYILRKLDKMRHVTAVVPLRHKSQLAEARSPVAYKCSLFIPENSLRKDIQLSRPNLNKLQLDLPTHCLDEIPLIQEISKKYLLIPRIRPTSTNDYVKNINDNIHDSTDWKSKYDILEKLRKNEKDEQADKYEAPTKEHFLESTLNKEPTFNRKIDEDFHLNKYQTENDDIILKYKNELPEKDLSHRKLYESESVKKYQENEKEISKASIPESTNNKNDILSVNKEDFDKDNVNPPKEYEDFHKTNNEEEIICDTNLDFGYHQHNEIANLKPLQNPDIDIVDTNVERKCLTQNEPMTYKELPVEEEKSNTEESEKVILQDGGELSSVQVINSCKVVNEINDEVPLEEESITSKNLESPVNIMNSQEFTAVEDDTLEDGVNINPIGHIMESQSSLDPSNQYESQTPIVTEHINDSVDTTGMNELDAEQNGMFYAENTEANYAYNQESVEHPYNAEYPQESVEYPQESVEHPYNAEYPPASENYQQNEEYTYYEGTQPDQTYPVEMNEHQETPEHYDQTYEQQYANFEQQEYLQQQEGYEQQTQQYEPHPTTFESYDQPEQVLDQLEQVLDQPEQVLDQPEQVLDQPEQVLDQPPYEQQQNYDLNNPDPEVDNVQGFVEDEKIERDESIAQENLQAEQEIKESL